MGTSPPARSASKARGGFACCSKRATRTQSEAGDARTDPLSPIKPEEEADATELGVEASFAEEEADATIRLEPRHSEEEGPTRDAAEDTWETSISSEARLGAHVDRAPLASERGCDDGVDVFVDVFDEDVVSQVSSSLRVATRELCESETSEARAVATALAASLAAEDDNTGDSAEYASDIAARDRDVCAHELSDGALSERRASSASGEDEKKEKGVAASAAPDESTPLLKASSSSDVDAVVAAANVVANGVANGVATVSAGTAAGTASSTSEDENALLLSARGSSKRRRFARLWTPRRVSAKSAVLAAATVAACAACAVGVLTLRFATPRTTVVVGPDAEALAASSRSSPRRSRGATETRRGGKASRIEDKKRAPTRGKKKSASSTKAKLSEHQQHHRHRDEGTRIVETSSKTSSSKTSSKTSSSKTSSSKTSSNLKASSRASSAAPPTAPRTAHRAHDDDAEYDDTVSTLGLNAPRVTAACVSSLGEARHGVHMQTAPDAPRAEGNAPACQKCYLKGTPAETQKRSMRWCRHSVCESRGVRGCAPASYGDESPEDLEASQRRASTARREARRESSSDARKKLDVSRDELVRERYEPSPPKSRFSEQKSHRDDRARRSASSDRRAPTPERRVGRCHTEPGDADFGRYMWEDPSCGAAAKHSRAGCVDQGTHHCRFCDAEVKDESRTSREASLGEGKFATCPRDVCDAHNLFWELCEES